MIFDRSQSAFVVVESELDGIPINQEAGDIVGTVALGNAQAKPDARTYGLLKEAETILVSLDYDNAGASASWGHWLKGYKNARRWPVASGKDPSDYYRDSGNIRAWIEAGLSYEKPIEYKQNDEVVKPFPKEWLERFDIAILEHLAIMTVDGGLSDTEALERVCRI